ncbi:MAG: Ig-like domain-containing protein [Lachnospira sp.]
MGNIKNNKLKIKPIWIGVAAVALTAAIVLIIVAVTGSSDKDTEKVNVNLNNVDLNNGAGGASVGNKEKTTVEIQMTDSAVLVGKRFKMVAVVTPANTEQALVWSVSDDNILEVTNDGVVTVKAVGTATVSATVGDVTDAVIIEGIARIEDGSKNKFPIYTLADNAVSGDESTGSNGGNGGAGSSNSGSTGSAGSNGGNGSSNSGSAGSSNSGSTGSGSSNSQSTGSNGGSGSSNSESTGSNGGSGSSNSGSTGSNGGSGSSNGGSTGSNSESIGGQLPDMGFDQTYSNVYVCNENGTYCGEIITQPDVTIIYIKERSGAFDSKIKNVLMTMLPKEYNQVWNNYISAATDRTFTVEDRKVRIVAAVNGGHSQIVIYN